MTIKELENELKIPRATIRFYEKENLISPARSNNGYRDYSEDDLSKLKKIITLRKLGITVNDIKSVFEGDNELENIVTENIKEIEKQIKELSSALNLSKVICERKDSIESFDEDFYWNCVETEEKNGNKFIGIEEIEKMNRYGKNYTIMLIITVVSSVPLFMWLGVWALIPWGIIWAISMYFAIKVEKIKKDNDVQTYKEIVAFSEGKLLEDIYKQREIGKRPYQKLLLVIGSALITFIVCVLIGLLLHIFLN